MNDAAADTRMPASHGGDDGASYPLQRGGRFFASGVLLLVLMGFAAAVAARAAVPALTHVESASLNGIMRGAWSPRLEKSLGEALPGATAARGLWAQAEYAAFHEGRKGVLVGSNGWLYTEEELSCPAHYAASLHDNLEFVNATRARLKAAGVDLAVVLVPAKEQVVPGHLGAIRVPACRADVYGQARDDLSARGIPVVDLLTPMQAEADRDSLYLRTDTHWTPAGARLAAKNAARAIRAALPKTSLPVEDFVSVQGNVSLHQGDLMRYVPGIDLSRDMVAGFTTEPRVKTASAGQDLFGDAPVPQVVLVGTSYSANAKWNFAGFLKESLKTDVLNVAQEGQGPFTVMDKYLASDAWKSSPPRLVVWEMPARYLLMPHGTSSN